MKNRYALSIMGAVVFYFLSFGPVACLVYRVYPGQGPPPKLQAFLIPIYTPAESLAIEFDAYDAYLMWWAQKGIRARSPESRLEALNPQLTDRVQERISELKLESLPDSLSVLLDINMFYSPGADPAVRRGGSLAELVAELEHDWGTYDLIKIITNRRVSKILEEIRDVDRDEATELIKGELNSTLSLYKVRYEILKQRLSGDTIDHIAELAKPENEGKQVYDIDPAAGGISYAPKGAVTMNGIRLKLLSLVWIASQLNLSGVSEEVEQVLNLGISQIEELTYEPNLIISANLNSEEEYAAMLREYDVASALWTLGIYNRQILGQALLSISELSRESQVEVVEMIGLEWNEKDLPRFNAAYTEFDQLHSREADFSKGKIAVRFLAPLTDDQFNELLDALGYSKKGSVPESRNVRLPLSMAGG